ncbi:N-acetyl-1-D-myo-inositol-2-amino-2-deoxy-alpha-D-glucopyranoside deacetylase [Corynebacterium freiburgense]|uniref:N-acetyl-1-D-myo-inositol-2-amino-2-deoxy-alpha- D-glucopyranoside deacetylase n=1 Tax=Corynebacterium freiburgense TaxID=556548 RepID=UPI00041F0AB2|nr:N-acetyl-1-D-myo-inositol-2-amino-2-deoxy-alpha-D-glucopyranoside deacetylase [Corynebacterium freiburgense]WJZ02262.1 1D-myo-inositol 2-acetamido-2-deoxy-alpha-D-glucopyranoside deacetylase [Corynebacterium freiburgense]
MSDLVGARVVAVHAHPDDEAIWTGGTLATLSARGAEVTVVTCTLGEQGEVIGEPYQGLVRTDQLGGFRIHELANSLDHLGVRGEFLGGVACWRDSGMIGDPANDRPGAFVHSGEAAVHQLKEILERLRPHLVITYGPDGGYGHPDHIRAHEITHAAVAGTSVQRVLWAVTGANDFERGLAAIEEIPQVWRRADHELARQQDVDVRIALSDAAYAAKVRAFEAHATQLWVANGSVSAVNPLAAFARTSNIDAAPLVFALSNLIAQPLMRYEHFQYGWGTPLTLAQCPMEGLSW